MHDLHEGAHMSNLLFHLVQILANDNAIVNNSPFPHQHQHSPDSLIPGSLLKGADKASELNLGGCGEV